MPSLGFRDQKLLYIFSEKKQSTKYIFNYTSIPQMCEEWETQGVKILYLSEFRVLFEQNDYIFRINDIYLLGKTLRNRDQNL